MLSCCETICFGDTTFVSRWIELKIAPNYSSFRFGRWSKKKRTRLWISSAIYQRRPVNYPIHQEKSSALHLLNSITFRIGRQCNFGIGYWNWKRNVGIITELPSFLIRLVPLADFGQSFLDLLEYRGQFLHLQIVDCLLHLFSPNHDLVNESNSKIH